MLKSIDASDIRHDDSILQTAYAEPDYDLGKLPPLFPKKEITYYLITEFCD